MASDEQAVAVESDEVVSGPEVDLRKVIYGAGEGLDGPGTGPEVTTKDAEPKAEVKAEPKPKAPEATEKADKTEKPAAESEPTPKGEAVWDKEAQARDQAHANERKVLMGQIGDLQAKLDGVIEHQQNAKVSIVAAEKQEVVDSAKRLVDGLGTGETADGEELTAAIKGLVGLIDTLGDKQGDADRVASLEADVARLTASQTEMREQTEQNEAKRAAEAGNTAWTDLLANMDKTYGEEFRTEAVRAATAHFTAEGFTQDDSPSGREVSARVETEYLRLKAAKGGKPAPVPVPEVALDPGVGGGATPTAGGNIKENVERMRRAGQFKKLSIPGLV